MLKYGGEPLQRGSRTMVEDNDIMCDTSPDALASTKEDTIRISMCQLSRVHSFSFFKHGDSPSSSRSVASPSWNTSVVLRLPTLAPASLLKTKLFLCLLT